MSKKSRKLIRSAAAPGAAHKPAEVVPAPEPERTFWFLPDAEPEPVDERDLHDTMKQWRHGRATPPPETHGAHAMQNGFTVLR